MALMIVAAPVARANGGETRFSLSAELRVRHVATDQRFAIDTAAQGAPKAPSPHARFALKVVERATCDPNDDLIFSDGFEPSSP